MSYLDRLKERVELTSPGGQEFDAGWRGDPRKVEKKLGIFNYTGANGTVLQDLGITGSVYPLKLYFDSDDHDLDADRFIRALAERGTWRVVHPVRGVLELQPASASEDIQPVESAAYTRIDTDWFDALDPDVIASAAQIAAQVRISAQTVDVAAVDQLTESAKQDNTAQSVALETATNEGISGVDQTLGALIDSTGEAQAADAAVTRGISQTFESAPSDVEVIGSQILAKTRIPALFGTGPIMAKIQNYTDLIQYIADLPETTESEVARNVMQIRETFMAAALATSALIAVSGTVHSRAEAITLAEILSNQFEFATDVLDAAQERFSGERIDKQYFSQSQSFSATALTTAQAAAYLLRRAFELPIEKRIILAKPRAPIEITITEYGTDERYDEFIETNDLKGNDIMLLPAGREVVVYV